LVYHRIFLTQTEFFRFIGIRFVSSSIAAEGYMLLSIRAALLPYGKTNHDTLFRNF